ncbi:MAG: multiheme c-type cytochrome [Terriglobia bacterium]
MGSRSAAGASALLIGQVPRATVVILLLASTVAGQTARTPQAPPKHPRPVPACAACHEQAQSQPATSMAHALETVEECTTLSAHPLLTFTAGKYSYRIESRGDQSLYSVSDGVQTLTMPIRWAMGASSAIGQTYILEKEGELYESRVSYFSELNGLDVTMGAQDVTPANLLDAAGRRMDHEDKLQCFGCHATNATEGRQVTLDKMVPGVQCERCHGPAEKHLADMTTGNSEPAKMKGLSTMSTDQISGFCGQCHRTWDEVIAQGRFDITDIRFQPYRLTGSKCYDVDDPRISCLACHDPHRELDSNSVDYDSKCQACHAGGKRGARTCKVATNHCASCHMPKIELPGAHHKFTEHRIRILKANEPFPG